MNTSVNRTKQFFYRYLFDLHGLFGELGFFGKNGALMRLFRSLGERIAASWLSFIASVGVMLDPIPELGTRRPALSRAALHYEHGSQARRYIRGVEAAAQFELPKGVIPFSVLSANTESTLKMKADAKKRPSNFRRHRGLIVVCSILLVLGIGSVAAYEAFFSNNFFIDNEQEAGNITIADRLETSKESKEDVVYVLLLAVDQDEMLTDCIWLMCYDIKANNVNVLQIPRDTYVGNESYSGKINGVYSKPKTVKWCEDCGCSPDPDEIDSGIHTACGTKLTSKKESNVSATIRVINNFLGLPIDHYVIFNFAGFAKIVDAIDGVDVTIERRIHDSAITLEAGTHHLDGATAVNFMRHRKSFAAGDVARVSNQRILVNAMLDKVMAMDVSEMLSLVTKCVGCFQTDLSLSELKDYALTARSLRSENLSMMTMPGTDFWDRSVANSQSYYLCSESATVDMINEFMLPYGLPDGSYATINSVNFPTLNTRTANRTTTTTQHHGTTTTAYSSFDITTNPNTEPTDPLNTTTSTQYVDVTTTTTEPPSVITDAPTTTTTTTTTTTAAPTTTTTYSGVVG